MENGFELIWRGNFRFRMAELHSELRPPWAAKVIEADMLAKLCEEVDAHEEIYARSTKNFLSPPIAGTAPSPRAAEAISWFVVIQDFTAQNRIFCVAGRAYMGFDGWAVWMFAG